MPGAASDTADGGMPTRRPSPTSGRFDLVVNTALRTSSRVSGRPQSGHRHVDPRRSPGRFGGNAPFTAGERAAPALAGPEAFAVVNALRSDLGTRPSRGSGQDSPGAGPWRGPLTLSHVTSLNAIWEGETWSIGFEAYTPAARCST
jgi:hypothetical protein